MAASDSHFDGRLGVLLCVLDEDLCPSASGLKRWTLRKLLVFARACLPGLKASLVL